MPFCATLLTRSTCAKRKTQPWYIAKEKGAFAAAGIDLEYTDYPGGTGAMTKALNENALDVAVLLTEGCVKVWQVFGVALLFQFNVLSNWQNSG